MKKHLATYRLSKENVKQINHLIDTDEAFIPDSLICEDDCDLRYEIDRIATDHVEDIKTRNTQKRKNSSVLASWDKIFNIPYRMYYFSRNREHALNDQFEELSDSEKIDMADAYHEHYKDALDDWLAHINDTAIAVEGDYQQTWVYIMTEAHSLQRHSNFHLIFSHAECSD